VKQISVFFVGLLVKYQPYLREAQINN